MAAQTLTSARLEMDVTDTAFGDLRSSAGLVGNDEALRNRMAEDGYLFLPGYLDRDEVMAARKAITDGLAAAGYLDPAYDPIEARAGDPSRRGPWNEGLFSHNGNRVIQANNPALFHLLYEGRMMEFYARYFQAPVRHYDFTWLRIMFPGAVSPPHCDIVYMGRGTPDLYTSWTPLGDAPLDLGGLMILEGSHRHERLKAGYGQKDVDSFCANRRGNDYRGMGGGGNIAPGGALSHNPVRLRERIGGRWLSAEYSAGDLVVFSMFTVHASLDNRSDRIRLSSDSRYQRADEPADDRWVGENPSAHGANSKRGFIC